MIRFPNFVFSALCVGAMCLALLPEGRLRAQPTVQPTAGQPAPAIPSNPNSGGAAPAPVVVPPSGQASAAGRGVAPGNGAAQTVDFTADVMRPVQLGDSTALSLVGKVTFYHNGAVISCDSAIRYNDRMMDCYRNVIINKDSTFIYGERANYDGTTNTAQVFDQLVKMVDKDATFYTYNLLFNTQTNIGYYTSGGTMLQGKNRMESKRGYYFLDTRDLVGVDQVEMSSPEYQLRSDSVSYNLDTEIAAFYTRSYLWNEGGEFLTAIRGNYDVRSDRYTFTDNSYILTKTQELWADTLTYDQRIQDAVCRRNIQVIDQENRVMGFGDFAHYWGEQKRGLLTDSPSILQFEQGKDTLFMRSDSIYLYTYNRFDTVARQVTTEDSLALQAGLPASGDLSPEVLSRLPGDENSANQEQPGNSPPPETNENLEGLNPEGHLHAAPEEQPPTDIPAAKIEQEYAAETAAQQEKVKDAALEKEKAVKDSGNPSKGLSDAERKAAQQAQKQEAKRLKQNLRQARLDERSQKADPKPLDVSDQEHPHEHPGLTPPQIDSLNRRDSLARLTAAHLEDTLTQADLIADSARLKALENADSIVRRIHAYHNVKVYRKDMQAVCDSLVGFTLDSTMHLYIDPVLWNEENQVTADTIHIQTKNQQLDHALFLGDPIMCSRVDEIHYNQIKGKEIEAFFKEGAIARMDANGNGQTYYYMMEGEGEDAYISGFMTVECSDISFYFEQEQLDRIVWRGNPNYVIYPMDKLPEEQAQMLQGFTWEEERRPSQEDVFSREMRPSQREMYEALERPRHPITEQINALRVQLVKAGLWYDRTDALSSEAQEFIRTLK